jgi:hypothetical protein
MSELIKFKPNIQKLIEVILYVVSNNPKHNRLSLIKILFCADKCHLNLYGRPVTGDSYKRTKIGPVPKRVFHLISGNKNFLTKLNIKEVPFLKTRSGLSATRDSNLNFLSKSDIEILDFAIKNNNSDDCLLNNKWIKTKSNYISFEEMIEDPEILSYLKENSFLIAF